jgi:hypothetical protein
MTFEEILPRLPEEMNWKNIGTEEHRTYQFPDEQYVTIKFPIALAVAESGSHRRVVAGGLSHYIPSGFIHIEWKANPPFSF